MCDNRAKSERDQQAIGLPTRWPKKARAQLCKQKESREAHRRRGNLCRRIVGPAPFSQLGSLATCAGRYSLLCVECGRIAPKFTAGKVRQSNSRLRWKIKRRECLRRNPVQVRWTVPVLPGRARAFLAGTAIDLFHLRSGLASTASRSIRTHIMRISSLPALTRLGNLRSSTLLPI